MTHNNCPKCGKENDNRVSFCPQCNTPLNKITTLLTIENLKNWEEFEIPEKKEGLKLGKQITNWKFDTAFDGFYDIRENTLTDIPQGRVTVLLHSHGIRILGGLKGMNGIKNMMFYPIHNLQIISLYRVSAAETYETFPELTREHYFMIVYWNFETTSAQTILISLCPKTLSSLFINNLMWITSLNLWRYNYVSLS